MKKSDKLLVRARSLLKNRKYSSVIRLLESKVPKYLESSEFMLFLGAACFHIGDLGGAVSYLNRGDRIDPDNRDIQLYLAATNLKKNNTTEAVRIWLAILDADQNNKQAKKGLETIRNIENPEEHRRFCQSKTVLQLVTGFGTPVSNWVFLFLLLIFAGIVFSFTAVILTQKDWFVNRNASRSEKIGLSRRVDLNQPIIEAGGSPLVLMTENEVKESFFKAMASFNDGDDNAAQYEINRIKLSNASSVIKGKVHILEGHLITPSFDTFRTNFDYADIAVNPLHYQGCHVLWKGRVSNLVSDDNSVDFDFLVGYDSGKVLEGIIPVHFDFYTTINTSLPVELIGRLELKEGKPVLTGVSIHTIISD
jgi:hypothetical protein